MKISTRGELHGHKITFSAIFAILFSLQLNISVQLSFANRVNRSLCCVLYVRSKNRLSVQYEYQCVEPRIKEFLG